RPFGARSEVPADLPGGRPHEPLELGPSPPGPRYPAARGTDRDHAAPRPRLPDAAAAEVDRRRARAVLRESEGGAEGHEARAVGTARADDPQGAGAADAERRARR